MRHQPNNGTCHEIHDTCHSVTFYFMKNTFSDVRKLVFHEIQCNRMTGVMEFMGWDFCLFGDKQTWLCDETRSQMKYSETNPHESDRQREKLSENVCLHKPRLNSCHNHFSYKHSASLTMKSLPNYSVIITYYTPFYGNYIPFLSTPVSAEVSYVQDCVFLQIYKNI